jgi:hypothetical protein
MNLIDRRPQQCIDRTTRLAIGLSGGRCVVSNYELAINAWRVANMLSPQHQPSAVTCDPPSFVGGLFVSIHFQLQHLQSSDMKWLPVNATTAATAD